MKTKNKMLSFEIVPESTVNKNNVLVESVEYYSKISSIMDRTHKAMGKMKEFKATVSATTNQKLNTNMYASTH